MVCIVSKPGDSVSPGDAQDITLKVEQWQHLAGPDQVFRHIYLCFELHFWI